jgi:hypothetical protein
LTGNDKKTHCLHQTTVFWKKNIFCLFPQKNSAEDIGTEKKPDTVKVTDASDVITVHSSDVSEENVARNRFHKTSFGPKKFHPHIWDTFPP